MATQRNAGLVRRAVEEIWNEGNLDVADVLFAPTYVNHGGLIPDLVCGPEAIKASVALYRSAFPGLHLTLEAVLDRDELIEARWVARNTGAGARGGGAAGTLRGTIVCRLAAGQIAESWTDWDSAAVLHRLGLSPPEAPMGDGADPPSGQAGA